MYRHRKLLLLMVLSLILVVSATHGYVKGISTYSMMSDNIRFMLEEIRDRMHMDMTDTMGIPRLDPFTADRLDIDGFGDIIDMGDDFNMNLTNIRATGLKQFVVDDAEFAIVGLKFLLNLTVPTTIDVSGNYESDGYAGGMFLMRGRGAFNFNITGMSLSVNGQLQYAAGNWTMKSMSIDFGIKGLSVEFQGMENMGDFLNEMLSAIGPEVLDELWPKIEPIVVEAASEMMEESLSGMTLAEILTIMSGTVDIFPPITHS